MTIFLLYSALFILLAYFETRQLRNKEDYFVAGRKASSIQTGFSIIASCVGASATIGMTGLAFSVGLPAIWWLLSGAIGLCVLRVFLLKRIRHQPHLTMLEIVNSRLGAQATKLCAAVIVIAWISILAAQFSAMGAIVAQMSDLSTGTALFIGSAVILLYTLLGGLAAVMKSDVIQLSVMMVGLSILLFSLIFLDAHPLNALNFELLNSQFTLSDWSRFTLLIGGSYVVCPMLFTRFMSTRSDQCAQKGALIAIVGLVLIALIIVLIGIEARHFLDPSTPSDQVLAAVADKLPFGAGTLLSLVLISAILSSADSCLITAATVVSNDLLNRPSITLSRTVMIVLSAFGLYLASSGKAVLDLLLMANNIYVCAVVAPVFCALCSNTPLRRPIILITLATSSILALIGEWQQTVEFSYIAFSISVCGSFLARQIAHQTHINDCFKLESNHSRIVLDE